MIWGHSTVYIHIGQYPLCYQFQPVQPIRKQALEPVCCKKHPKIVPDQLLVWGIMGPLKVLKVLNGTKLILDDHWNDLDSSRISLESFRSFRGPLLHKLVTGQELFFAVSYSKPALRAYCPNMYTMGRSHFQSEQIDFCNKLSIIDLYTTRFVEHVQT